MVANRATIAVMRNRKPSTVVRHEPAATIIKLIGGRKVVAQLTGKHPASVSRWSMGGKYGMYGRIPEEFHDLLLDYAKQNGILLNRSMFMPLADQHGSLGVVKLTEAGGSFVVVTASVTN